MKYFVALLFPVLLLMASCRRAGGVSASIPGGDTLAMHYAENLTMVVYPDYTLATLRNPWDTLKTLHTYILVPKDKKLPRTLPKGTLVRIPLANSLVYSAVHAGLIEELDAEKQIGGVCDLKYMRRPFVQEGCQQGTIVDCGASANPDIERIIDLHPDAILLSPYQDNNGYGRLAKLGVPIIECADYMETSALGRAEWMRFYGLLYGASACADSLFAGVEDNYKRLKSRALLSSTSYSLLADLKYGSVWYISGAHTTMGRMYEDACGRYAFAYLKQGGAVPMSFETVYDKAGESDIWIVKYNRPQDMTYADLEAEYAGYARFKAFRERKIYGCNTARISYYEETPFHPDRLLADLIQILHPEIRLKDGLRYFSLLEEK